VLVIQVQQRRFATSTPTEDRDKAIAEAISAFASDAQVIGITEAKQRPSRTQRARWVSP
jgi:hypothetical protein